MTKSSTALFALLVLALLTSCNKKDDTVAEPDTTATELAIRHDWKLVGFKSFGNDTFTTHYNIDGDISPLAYSVMKFRVDSVVHVMSDSVSTEAWAYKVMTPSRVRIFGNPNNTSAQSDGDYDILTLTEDTLVFQYVEDQPTAHKYVRMN